MDTVDTSEEELKQKSKRKFKEQMVLLSLGWIFLISLAIMVAIEFAHTEVFIINFLADIVTELKWAGSIILIISLSIMTVVTSRWCKRQRLLSFIHERPIDRMPLELLLIAIILTIIACGVGIPKLYYLDNPVANGDEILAFFWYLIGILTVAALFYEEVVLLIRKEILLGLKNTSFLVQMKRQYRTQTPLENQVLSHYKGFYLVATILSGEILLFSVFMEVPGFYFLVVLMCLCLIVMIIRYWGSDTLPKDAVKLMQDIHAIQQDIESADITPLSEESLLYETSCALADIKRQMEENMESRMRSERMKVDLITNVSHDLKTPLTSMVGYTELLKKEEMSQAAKDYVEIISDKQEKLADMIQNIFELSKATSNSEQLDIQVLDMNKLLEQIMGDMEDILSACDFTYVKKLSEEPLLFYGDNNKMYRVVQNLLENTVKYAMANTRVFIETWASEGKVMLAVKNIASYEMDFDSEEIVERFARGDKARTTEGHGLGLAIASSLLDNMKGTMKIEVEGDMFKVLIALEEKKTDS